MSSSSSNIQEDVLNTISLSSSRRSTRMAAQISKEKTKALFDEKDGKVFVGKIAELVVGCVIKKEFPGHGFFKGRIDRVTLNGGKKIWIRKN